MAKRSSGVTCPLLLIMALACGGLLALSAGAQEDDGSPEALEWAVIEAETALGHGEPQSAESHYRSALLEGWFLLGLLEVAADDLPAARTALLRATHAAAIEAREAETALAAVRLQISPPAPQRSVVTGAPPPSEVEAAVTALRLLAQQQPGDAVARRRLVQALALAGKGEEARQEIGELRALDPQAAAELAAALDAETGPERRQALLPAIDVGLLAGRSAAERAELRRRILATLARIYRNLGALQTWAGRPAQAAASFAEAAAVGDGDGAFGRVELRADAPPPRVKPQGLDPAALREAAPESLLPVIRQLDDGQLAAAEAELRRALARDDVSATRDLLAVVLSHQGRYPEAEAELAAVIAAAPKLLPARQHLARIYLLLDREDEAAAELRYAAELGDLERDLALELAAIERAAGRRPAANRQLRSVARRFESTRAFVQLSEIASGLGNTKQALDFSRRARGLAPSSEEVLALHARNALAARIPSTAARAVEPLAKMHPAVAEYQFLLGRVWTQLGKPGEAAEPLERAVELDPQHLDALLLLGRALNHERRYDEARSYLTRRLKADPEDLEALAALAEAEERIGDPEAAERLARQVLGTETGDPSATAVATAHLVVAMVHMRQQRFAEAREVLERAVAADPELAKAHYQLSLACARLGDGDGAERHLELFRRAQGGPEEELVQPVARPD